jgi:hypothetical protein
MTAVRQQKQFRRWILLLSDVFPKDKIGLADSLSWDADKCAKMESKANGEAGSGSTT